MRRVTPFHVAFHPHPLPFSLREKGVDPLSQRERSGGEGERRAGLLRSARVEMQLRDLGPPRIAH
jgi:hypothetical protein